jgi:hypothetical protein
MESARINSFLTLADKCGIAPSAFADVEHLPIVSYIRDRKTEISFIPVTNSLGETVMLQKKDRGNAIGVMVALATKDGYSIGVALSHPGEKTILEMEDGSYEYTVEGEDTFDRYKGLSIAFGRALHGSDITLPRNSNVWKQFEEFVNRCAYYFSNPNKRDSVKASNWRRQNIFRGDSSHPASLVKNLGGRGLTKREENRLRDLQMRADKISKA